MGKAEPGYWLSIVTGFERSLRRLEQSSVYRHDLSDKSFARWSGGQPACIPFQDDTEWIEMVRAKTAAGATIERVRIIDDPMTPYQTWLIPASSEIVAAGEVHKYVTRRVAAEVLGVHRADGDWWLVDDTTLVFFDSTHGWGQISSVESEVVVARGVWRRAWGSSRERAVA